MFCITSCVSNLYAISNVAHGGSGYRLFFTDCHGEEYSMRCNRDVFRTLREEITSDTLAFVGFRIVSSAPSYRIATAVYPIGGDYGYDFPDRLYTKLSSGGDV